MKQQLRLPYSFMERTRYIESLAKQLDRDYSVDGLRKACQQAINVQNGLNTIPCSRREFSQFLYKLIRWLRLIGNKIAKCIKK